MSEGETRFFNRLKVGPHPLGVNNLYPYWHFRTVRDSEDVRCESDIHRQPEGIPVREKLHSVHFQLTHQQPSVQMLHSLAAKSADCDLDTWSARVFSMYVNKEYVCAVRTCCALLQTMAQRQKKPLHTQHVIEVQNLLAHNLSKLGQHVDAVVPLLLLACNLPTAEECLLLQISSTAQMYGDYYLSIASVVQVLKAQACIRSPLNWSQLTNTQECLVQNIQKKVTSTNINVTTPLNMLGKDSTVVYMSNDNNVMKSIYTQLLYFFKQPSTSVIYKGSLLSLLADMLIVLFLCVHRTCLMAVYNDSLEGVGKEYQDQILHTLHSNYKRVVYASPCFGDCSTQHLGERLCSSFNWSFEEKKNVYFDNHYVFSLYPDLLCPEYIPMTVEEGTCEEMMYNLVGMARETAIAIMKPIYLQRERDARLLKGTITTEEATSMYGDVEESSLLLEQICTVLRFSMNCRNKGKLHVSGDSELTSLFEQMPSPSMTETWFFGTKFVTDEVFDPATLSVLAGLFQHYTGKKKLKLDCYNEEGACTSEIVAKTQFSAMTPTSLFTKSAKSYWFPDRPDGVLEQRDLDIVESTVEKEDLNVEEEPQVLFQARTILASEAEVVAEDGKILRNTAKPINPKFQ